LWQFDWVRSSYVQQTSRLWASRGGEFFTRSERREDEAAVVRQQRRSGGLDRFELVPYGWDWTPPDGPDAVGYASAMKIIETLPCEVLFIHMPLETGFREAEMPVVSKRFFDEIVTDVTERGYDFVDLNGPPWPGGEPFFLTRTHLNIFGCSNTSKLFTDLLLVPRLSDDG
jgi:hypothetical protein